MENPQMLHQIRNGSVKECEVEMVGEECQVYCEDGRRRVLVLTGHAGRVAPISPTKGVENCDFFTVGGRRVDGTLKLRSGTRRHILNTIPSICRVQHENCRFRFSSGSPAPTLSKPSRARVLTSA